MRDLADVIWRQGQRRHRAWLVFGWVIPLGQLFIPKMFINDLWAASSTGTAASSRTSPAHGMVAVRPRRGECIQRCPRGTEEGGHHEPGSPGPASDHVQRWSGHLCRCTVDHRRLAAHSQVGARRTDCDSACCLTGGSSDILRIPGYSHAHAVGGVPMGDVKRLWVRSTAEVRRRVSDLRPRYGSTL